MCHVEYCINCGNFEAGSISGGHVDYCSDECHAEAMELFARDAEELEDWEPEVENAAREMAEKWDDELDAEVRTMMEI